MKKKRLVFFALASACVLMLAMTAAPQARRAKIIRPVVQPAATTAPADWSTPVNISKTGTLSESPVIDVDSLGNAYVTWVEWTGYGMGRNMMFTTNESGQWPASRVVAPLGYDSIDDVGFPTIAVLGDKKAYVGYHDADFSRMVMAIIGWEYSNGFFGSRQVVSDVAPSSSYVTLANSPKDNNLHAVFMSDVEQLALAGRYRDQNSKQWLNADVLPLNQGNSSYLPHMCIDAKGTAHLVWVIRPHFSVVWYSKNSTPTNHGAWTSPIQISESTGLDWTWPKVTADADGNAYVVWYEETIGNREIMLRKQVNGQWQAAENISKTPDLSETASISVNPTTKEVYIAWQEKIGTNWEILAKFYELDKASGTNKWSNNINFTNSSGQSGTPSIRVAPTGDIHLVYFDDAGYNWEIFHTFKMKIRIYAPSSVTLTTAINKILFFSEKMNTITFAKNTDNDDSLVANYKLYRRKAEEADTKFELLTTMNTSTFKYDDRKLPLNQKYAYALSTIDKDGNESPKTTAVVEK